MGARGIPDDALFSCLCAAELSGLQLTGGENYFVSAGTPAAGKSFR